MNTERIPIPSLETHPQQHSIFSDLTGTDWQQLLESVSEEGVLQPIIVSRRTGTPVIIDGHQRVRAAEHAGYNDVPAIERPFADEREESAFMLASNLRRRHLTNAQKRACIDNYLRLYPERSDRWAADELGVSHKTVAGRRTHLESGGAFPHLDTLEGRDGKQYPRAQPPSGQVDSTDFPEPFAYQSATVQPAEPQEAVVKGPTADEVAEAMIQFARRKFPNLSDNTLFHAGSRVMAKLTGSSARSQQDDNPLYGEVA